MLGPPSSCDTPEAKNVKTSAAPGIVPGTPHTRGGDEDHETTETALVILKKGNFCDFVW